ncbi:MAG: hypothetical protein WC765_00470 [Phycisphaerae bacterium]
MANEKPNTPPPAPINRDITGGRSMAPSNQPLTRTTKPISPVNLFITNARTERLVSPMNQDLTLSRTGKPTPPPNTESTKGGGK